MYCEVQNVLFMIANQEISRTEFILHSTSIRSRLM